MTKVTVAALQLAFSEDLDDNVAMVSDHVVKAAARGAKIILPPELFEGHYFCKVEDEALFANAKPIGEHPAVAEMRKVGFVPFALGLSVATVLAALSLTLIQLLGLGAAV